MEPDRELEERARRAYERGRWTGGAISALPILLAGAAVCALSHGGLRAAVLAGAAYAAAVVLWWKGMAFARGMWSGSAAGLCLLVATFAAHGLGAHVCDLHECVTNCAPKGIVGGLAGGAVLVALATRFPELRTPRWWLSAGGMAAIFGSVGCSCIAFVGLLAACGALALVALPAALILRPAQRSS